MEPTYSADHTARALTYLTTMFRGRPVITGLLSALVGRIQAVEDAAKTVIDGRQLGNPGAVGAPLDTLGAVVGEGRKGRSDSDLTEAIRLRVLINRCVSVMPQVLQIVAVAARGNPWEYAEQWPAGYSVLFGGDASAFRALATATGLVRPNGVDALAMHTTGALSGVLRPSAQGGGASRARGPGSYYGSASGSVFPHVQR